MEAAALNTAVPTILLADDDRAICTVLEQAIRRKGYNILSTDNGNTLLEWVKAGKGDIVITDVLMPEANGLDLLPQIKQLRPQMPVIVISAQNTLITAVKANELGAYEYLAKPFDLNVLLACVEKSIAMAQPCANEPEVIGDLVGDYSLAGTSPAMQEIYKVLARLVGIDLTVMITGESGTGKELIARALHSLGKRKDKDFVAVNMAAIPKELVESELFGHEKGAFTGATGRKSGKFEQAEGGTLFLDEIGDMPLDAQTKLLRVLQQGEFTTVGGVKPIKSNVRIICATHRDLFQLTKSGIFREDLYYRLNVVPLKIPPLRERTEDIPALAILFLKKASERGLPRKQLNDGAIQVMKDYLWPGNVRELENLVYRLAALYSDTVIDADSIRSELQISGQPPANGTIASSSLSDAVQSHLEAFFAAHRHNPPAPGLYDRIIRVVEKPLIELTLANTGGNQLKAAHILGINRNTLRKKIGELKIRDSQNGNSAVKTNNDD